MALPALPYCSAPRPECDSLAEALGQCEYLASEGALTTAKVAFQALVVSSALLLCAFYCCKHYVRGFKLWLVTYYTLVVAAQYILALAAPGSPPLHLFLPCSMASVNWLRYAGWLLIAPGIVIALAKMPGLIPHTYPRLLEPMLLLTLITVVLGISAAVCSDIAAKAAIFAVAAAFGIAAGVCTALQYRELYLLLGHPECRRPLLATAIPFYIVWIFYPILFMAGPEGFGSLSAASSDIAYAVVDLFKLAWGLGAWYVNSICQRLSAAHGTNEKTVTLPLGLGVAVVQGIREGGANHHEPHDSKEEASAPLCQAERGEISVAEAKKLQVESEEEELVPPGGLEQPANCDGLPRIGGGNSLGSRGSTGSRARLSIDVKERLKEIAPKSSDLSRPDSRNEENIASEQARASIESDPGPCGRRGRLSIDMRSRVQQIKRKSSEDGERADETDLEFRDPSRNSGAWSLGSKKDSRDFDVEPQQERDNEPHSQTRQPNSRLSLDMQARLVQVERRRESSDSATMGDEGGFDMASAARADMEEGAYMERFRRPATCGQEFVSKQSKKETVLDYGPAPIPARYPVQLLVATQSVVALEDALVQLLDHSAECPVVLDATADLVELNNLLSRIKRQGTARSYDLALVHSSLVASPLAQALRTQYNIKVVAFGAVKDCGEKGDDYDDWLAFRNGYMPNREMEPFDQMELMRIMALWVHRKDQRALRLWP